MHKNPPDTEMIVGRYGNVKLEHSCVQSYILFTCEMRYADNARAKRHDTSQNDHSTKDKSWSWRIKNLNPKTFIGLWLWLNWQSGHFQYQRSMVQIQSSANLLMNLYTVENEEKRPGMAHLKKVYSTTKFKPRIELRYFLLRSKDSRLLAEVRVYPWVLVTQVKAT